MTDERELHLDADREDIRKTMDQAGPLYIPEYLKNPEYRYYWNTYSERNPFKFKQALDLGYTYVHPDELQGYKEEIEGRHMGFASSTDGSKISVKLNDKDTAFLLKIPKDRFLKIQDVKLDEVREIERALEGKADEADRYGEIKISRLGKKAKDKIK